jgi:hypothetical protein
MQNHAQVFLIPGWFCLMMMLLILSLNFIGNTTMLAPMQFPAM